MDPVIGPMGLDQIHEFPVFLFGPSDFSPFFGFFFLRHLIQYKIINLGILNIF